MKNLENKILEKIKKEKIKPRSKLFFALKNILYCMLALVSLFFSSLFVAWLTFVVANGSLLSWSTLILFFLTGAMVLSIFALCGFLLFRNYKRLYREGAVKIFAWTFIAILALGSIFVYTRIHNRFDDVAARISQNASLRETINKRWSDAEEGRLFGHIEDYQESDLVTFRDVRKGIHLVDLSLLNSNDVDKIHENKNVLLKGFFQEEIFYPLIVLNKKIKFDRREVSPLKRKK